MSPHIWTAIAGAATLLNLFGFALMGWDKRQAQRRGPRIRERSLITVSLIGGSLGTLIGALALRHKTRKQPIAGVLKIIPLIQLGGVGLWLFH